MTLPWEYPCPACHHKGGMMFIMKYRNGIQGSYCKTCGNEHYIDFDAPYDK